MTTFARYTLAARRAVFFARNAAFNEGARQIEPGHILLGLAIETDSLANKAFRLNEIVVTRTLPDPPQTKAAFEPSLTIDAKRVLAYAEEEATRANDYWIDSDHLVLGIVREGSSAAAIRLREAGIVIELAREVVKRNCVSRAQYGPAPIWWPLERPLHRLGKLTAVIYLFVVFLLLNLVGHRFCAPLK